LSSVAPGAPALHAAGSAGTLSAGPGVPAWKRIAHYMMHSAHLVIEGAEMANIATGAAVGGAIGAAVISAGMTALGVSHVIDGVRNKSGEQVMEGLGAMLIGTRSGLEAIVMGGQHSHGLLAAAADGLHSVMAPLGVINGGAEALVGAWRFAHGVRHKDAAHMTAGFLTLGLGASVCAASLGLGLPAMIGAGAFLTGRIIFEERNNLKAVLKGTQLPPPPAVRSWRLYSS
jgi:hypothetical protein